MFLLAVNVNIVKFSGLVSPDVVFLFLHCSILCSIPFECKDRLPPEKIYSCILYLPIYYKSLVRPLK